MAIKWWTISPRRGPMWTRWFQIALGAGMQKVNPIREHAKEVDRPAPQEVHDPTFSHAQCKHQRRKQQIERGVALRDK